MRTVKLTTLGFLPMVDGEFISHNVSSKRSKSAQEREEKKRRKKAADIALLNAVAEAARKMKK